MKNEEMALSWYIVVLGVFVNIFILVISKGLFFLR